MTSQAPEFPALSPVKARGLLIGLHLFEVATGAAGWSTGRGHPIALAWLVAFAAFGMAAACGGFQFRPTSPRELRYAAQAAGWPAAIVIPLAYLCVTAGIAGIGYPFYVMATTAA